VRAAPIFPRFSAGVRKKPPAGGQLCGLRHLYFGKTMRAQPPQSVLRLSSPYYYPAKSWRAPTISLNLSVASVISVPSDFGFVLVLFFLRGLRASVVNTVFHFLSAPAVIQGTMVPPLCSLPLCATIEMNGNRYSFPIP
jgi:hypothetical protein